MDTDTPRLQSLTKHNASKTRPGAWWIGAALIPLTALAMWAAIAGAARGPARLAGGEPVQVHLITAVNAQSVRAHPNLPPTRRAGQVPAVARAAGQSGHAVAAPAATSLSLLSYLNPPSPIALGQAVPDAATAGVLRYLQAHAFRVLVPARTGPGAATRY